ncbi:hypothetical protein ERJ75_000377700 [Trypanosoma vivax]|nr:hypothetical protein ERJ75_000377700 [Trypanosoma vivax]
MVWIRGTRVRCRLTREQCRAAKQVTGERGGAQTHVDQSGDVEEGRRSGKVDSVIVGNGEVREEHGCGYYERKEAVRWGESKDTGGARVQHTVAKGSTKERMKLSRHRERAIVSSHCSASAEKGRRRTGQCPVSVEDNGAQAGKGGGELEGLCALTEQ